MKEKGSHNIHICIITTTQIQGIYVSGEDQQLLKAQLMCCDDLPAKATTLN